MTAFYIILAIYLLVALGFFFAIHTENLKNEYQFNVLQLIVVIFWPLWGLWYLWVIGSEAFINWKNK